MKNKKKNNAGDCIQWHHPDYDGFPDLKVPLYRREHFRITMLDRALRISKHKLPSKGFLFSLKELCRVYWGKGVDLCDYFKDKQ